MNKTPFYEHPRFTIIMKVVICLLAASLVSGIVIDMSFTPTIPHPLSGEYIVFHTPLGSSARISGIYATSDYIYFEFNSYTVIEVYDWDGTYIQSMSFHKEQKGSFKARTDNDLLHVSDYNSKEFVFSGITFVESKENHYKWWFYDAPKAPLKIKGKNLYDEDGSFIMLLPGKANTNILKEPNKAEAPIAASSLILAIMCGIIYTIVYEIKEKRQRKQKKTRLK